MLTRLVKNSDKFENNCSFLTKKTFFLEKKRLNVSFDRENVAVLLIIISYLVRKY